MGAIGTTPSGGTLQFAPGQDDITFNLAPGQFVDFASVDVFSNNTPMQVEFFDASTSFLITTGNFGGVFNTTGLGLGPITQIRISGSESGINEISINVVPEPTALALFAIGILLCLPAERPNPSTNIKI